jgi:hypothetical protein
VNETLVWSALALFGLGAFHGLNPGMGWLFAVALGIQEGRARAVWRALLPLALGHSLAVAGAVALVAVTGLVVPGALLRAVVGTMLIGFGAYRLFRHRHARWAGMKVSMAGLALWSFMMAMAHGAGLMVLPLVLERAPVVLFAGDDHTAHMQHPPAAEARQSRSAEGSVSIGPAAAAAVHGAGYLLVTALLAWIVYVHIGLTVLRTAWVNLDFVWAAALLATGILTLWV